MDAPLQQPGLWAGQWLTVSANLGGVTLLAGIALGLEWKLALFLLGPLALVPLGLRLAGQGSVWGCVATLLQFPAALALLAAFLNERMSELEKLLPIPWLVVTGLVALEGTARAYRRGIYPLADCCLNLGMIYLAVGGVWVLLFSWEMQPLGFSPLIAFLTAAHFHHAGFVLPVLASLAARDLKDRLSLAAAIGVVAFMPLVAAGITLSQLGHRDLEPIAAWLMSGATLLVGVQHLRLALRPGAVVPRLMLAVVGLTLFVTMPLAALYAWGRWTGIEIVDIPWMLPYHGAVNAIGFSLVGLLAWSLRRECELGEAVRGHPADGTGSPGPGAVGTTAVRAGR